MASVDTNMLAMLSGPESSQKRQRVAQFGVADLSTQTDASVNASEPTQIDSCEKEDDAASRSSASSPLMSIRGRRITIDRITDVVASWSDGDTEEDSRDAYVSHSIEAPASAASSPLINTRERRISLDRIEEVVASWSDRDTEDEPSAAHVAVRDSAGERAFGNALDSIKAPAVFRDSWIFRPDPGIMLRRQGEARAAVTGNADEGASESDEAAVDVSSSDIETEEADEVHLGGLCDNVGGTTSDSDAASGSPAKDADICHAQIHQVGELRYGDVTTAVDLVSSDSDAIDVGGVATAVDLSASDRECRHDARDESAHVSKPLWSCRFSKASERDGFFNTD
jgi:hypothetical protein